MPGLDWRTVHAARQYALDVDFLGDTQRIFKFDAKVSNCTVDLGMSEQKVNRSEISHFPVNLCRLGPAKRMRSVSAWFQSNRSHPVLDKPTVLARRDVWSTIYAIWLHRNRTRITWDVVSRS